MLFLFFFFTNCFGVVWFRIQYQSDHCTSKDSNKIWVNKCVKLWQFPVHRDFACEIQVKFVWRSMWNCIATCIHWEFACEICVKNHVKFYGKSVWMYMWNSMWNAGENVCELIKGLIYLTPFSHMFHYVIFYTCVKYECETHVKSSEKHVKQKCEKHTLFTHFFTWFFTYILLVVIGDGKLWYGQESGAGAARRMWYW